MDIFDERAAPRRVGETRKAIEVKILEVIKKKGLNGIKAIRLEDFRELARPVCGEFVNTVDFKAILMGCLPVANASVAFG